jgi:site-specific DNA-methyltransferase (adenine-specific)
MNKRLKLFDLLKAESATLFAGAHSIYTPKELTIEILSELSLKDKTILVMFNPEFVISLIEIFNVDPSAITFYSDHTNKNNLMELFSVKYIKELSNMKFDVIVGNPPFNDSAGNNRTEAKNTNNSNLYVEFIEKCLNIVDGQIALITPAAWMNNDKTKNKVIDAGLCKIKDVDPAYFPGVGIRSGISCFFTETGYNGDIKIQSKNNTYTINRHSTLTFDNPDKFELIDKVKSQTSFASLLKVGPYAIPKGTKGSIERLLEKDSSFVEKKDSAHSTKVIIYAGGKDTSERYLFSNQDNSKNKWGVVVPTASDKFIIGAVRIIEPGVGVSDRLKVAYFDSQKEAENVKKYLESKLIRFIIGTTKHNDTVSTNKNSFGNIPLISFKKEYTDDELYNLFNLTAEEINLVNAY